MSRKLELFDLDDILISRTRKENERVFYNPNFFGKLFTFCLQNPVHFPRSAIRIQTWEIRLIKSKLIFQLLGVCEWHSHETYSTWASWAYWWWDLEPIHSMINTIWPTQFDLHNWTYTIWPNYVTHKKRPRKEGDLMKRWPRWKGDPYVKLTQLGRWSRCEGDPDELVTQMERGPSNDKQSNKSVLECKHNTPRVYVWKPTYFSSDPWETLAKKVFCRMSFSGCLPSLLGLSACLACWNSLSCKAIRNLEASVTN